MAAEIGLWIALSLGSGALSAVIVLFLIPFLISWANHFNILDAPSDRRIHMTAVPRLGGIALFIGTLLGILLQEFLYAVSMPGILRISLGPFFFGAVGFFALGLIDDLLGLRAAIKLGGQVVIAGCLFMLDVRVDTILGFHIPVWLDLCLTVSWFILIVNAFNLIDGFDGVASGLCFISGLGIAGSLFFRGLHAEGLFLIPLMSAALAFLKFNRNPARIFLGDCGSFFIGFSLAWVSLVTVSKGPALAALWVPFLALGVPMFDVALAVWRRLVRRLYKKLTASTERVGLMAPDLEHVHHKLAGAGFNAHNVAALLYLANCALVIVGMIGLIVRESVFGVTLIFFMSATVLVIRYVASTEIQESGLVIRESWARSVLSWKDVGYILMSDTIGLVIVLFISVWLTFERFFSLQTIIDIWLVSLPAWVYMVALGMLAIDIFKALSDGHRQRVASLSIFYVIEIGVLLCVCAAVATRGFEYGRMQTVYYVSWSFIYLVGVRLIRFFR